MRAIRLVSFREDVLVEATPGHDQFIVATRWDDVPIDDPEGAILDLLTRMTLGPVSVANMASGGTRFYRIIERLAASVVNSLGIDDGGRPALSVVPITRTAKFTLPEFDADAPIQLSRFTTMRSHADELVLESPRSSYRVVLEREIASLAVTTLARPTTIRNLAERLRIAEPVLLDIARYLIAADMVLLGRHSDGIPHFAEADDQSLIPWSHHDLLFHSRSRLGQHDAPLGATFALADRIPAPPVVKPEPDGERFSLYRPELSDVVRMDRTLTELLEAPARQASAGAGRALTAEQLGELLYRVARVRSVEHASSSGAEYTISDRPYPCDGGSYELELYLALNDCQGIPRGLYHYEPVRHGLTMLAAPDEEFIELLDTARIAAGIKQHPPVLIIITTRIARLSWIYSGIAYATALKHTGALQQTLHLVAAAMGLLPQALPVGDGLSSNRAMSLNWPEEVGVGEFVVSAPADTTCPADD